MPALLYLCALFATASASAIDDTWHSYFTGSYPAEAEALAGQLEDRADSLVKSLLADSRKTPLAVAGEIDVVVSGGGNLDAYYMGIAMVLNRLQNTAGGNLTLKRFAGASAGGMMPFEVSLKGEGATLRTHLSYGTLCSQFASEYWSSVYAGWLQDHHWRQMAAWQTSNFKGSLNKLDGVVYLALSCLAPWPKLVMVDNFTADEDQATHAFVGTGTFYESYDGMPCSDGGAMSGKKMTPLFQDGARQQLIVDLLQAGEPISMVMAPINTTQYVELLRRGQDEVLGFLREGSCRSGAITVCPRGAKVSSHVCEQPSVKSIIIEV